MRRALPASTLFTCATLAAAAPAPLTGEALKEMVAGSVISLDTPLGTKVPMTFGLNNLVTGEASGMLGTFLGAARDRGRWWIEKDRLCIKWFRWFSGESRCMTIATEGDRIFWRKDDGDTGTATLVERAKPADRPSKRVAAADTSPDGAGSAKAKVVPAAAAPMPEKPKSAEKAPAPQIGQAKSGQAKSEQAQKPSRPKAPISLADMVRPSGGQPPAVMSVPAPAVAAPAPQPPAAEVLASSDPADPGPPQSAEPAPAAAPEATTAPPRGPVRVAEADPVPEREFAPPSRLSAVGDERAMPTFRVARVHWRDILNVRAGPSEYHEPVGAIPPFSRGVILTGACKGLWCPVRHGNVRGWVNRFYLVAE